MAAFHEPSCQGRAVKHTIISGILLLPLLVALPFLTALSSSDRFRLDYRRIYIPILGQATHHFGSHFTGKILLIWPHPAPGEAEKCRLQSEHSWDLSRHLHSTCIRVFPVWLDEFQPLMLHYYYFYYFFTVMFLSWEALSTFDPATRLVVTSHVVIYHCLCYLEEAIIQLFLITWSGGRWIVLQSPGDLAALVDLEYFTMCGWLISYICQGPNSCY